LRVVIDLQGAQSESRFRGIGRYSLNLTQAIARNPKQHEIFLVLNAAFPDSVCDLRETFRDLITQDHIRIFEIPAPTAECNTDNCWRVRAAEKIREQFLRELNPDVVLVTSHFEGYVDNAVTSIGMFAPELPVAVVAYDLVPYLNQSTYLSDEKHRNYYLRKMQGLIQAKLLLSISEATRKEVIAATGYPEDGIVNISTAVDERFQTMTVDEKFSQQIKQKYGIRDKFVLYAPGGFDERKNFGLLMRAFQYLPKRVRKRYQLVVLSKFNEVESRYIHELRSKAGLKNQNFVLTGWVPDEELITFYNIADLFIFPSLHEGFGLPVLEAMSCGAPVLAARATSLPEVVGWDEALFDPHDDNELVRKMTRALEDESFRNELRSSGRERAKLFSWDRSAAAALAALEKQFDKTFRPSITIGVLKKPRLAFVSPLPPERSGIADYSAELLPALSRHYEIDVIVDQPKMSDAWILANYPVRTVQWFFDHARRYDRILYQFGNSPFHKHMFPLIEKIPGVIVLHDFYLSNALRYMDIISRQTGIWKLVLYRSHGYNALREGAECSEASGIRYPANLQVLKMALGVIVHSEFSRVMADQWYGNHTACNWHVVPLLRTKVVRLDKHNARRKLSLSLDAFVVCSFGYLDPVKLDDRLIAAWRQSGLIKDKNAVLVFVGENHGGDYGQNLIKMIKNGHLQERIRITGWNDIETYRAYLEAADAAVQLRTRTRGETSAAVLDCMNYGLPTIVNANGSFGYLPKDAVVMLPDEFSDNELASALEKLHDALEFRQELGKRARRHIETHHNPTACAELYRQAIEDAYVTPKQQRRVLVSELANLVRQSGTPKGLERTGYAMAFNFPREPRLRQILVDVSNVASHDLKTGIERVVRQQTLGLIESPPLGYRVEPVYLTDAGGRWHYRYAREYTCRLLGLNSAVLPDDEVEVWPGDILYIADFFRDGIIDADRLGLYKKLSVLGIIQVFLIFDLLPMKFPQFFPPGDSAYQHELWLKSIVSTANGLICISKAVALDVETWIQSNDPAAADRLTIASLHLGADLPVMEKASTTSDQADVLFNSMKRRLDIVMLGTIEPRKGYLQTLAAFDLLWERGIDVNLVIVGKEGWKPLRDDLRRTIPEIVQKLKNHPEKDKRLFWLEGISDEFLNEIYKVANCLLFASEGEGFGLPLIEAAQHGTSIIARDIPVFREVAGDHAFYFNSLKAKDLADAVQDWLQQYKENRHPTSDGMPWLTWRQCVEHLKEILASLV
jgi:glycosyltransferase involved in cell wall biosynthesis